jgi:hypothetical protein
VDGNTNSDPVSFYPLFPAEIPLDVTHSEGMYLEEGVDVLILPSMLKQFTKVRRLMRTPLHASEQTQTFFPSQSVCGTTAINPGFVTKGTCAVLKLGSGDVAVEIKRVDE